MDTALPSYLVKLANLLSFSHLATSLPLSPERDHLRPRIDLVAFMIDIKSKYR